jgi:hypothetical protein
MSAARASIESYRFLSGLGLAAGHLDRQNVEQTQIGPKFYPRLSLEAEHKVS